MKIAISTQFNSAFQPVADITLPVLQEYCDRHGYTLLVDKDPEIRRSIVWDRYYNIGQYLNAFDWVAHFDADVLVTNLHIKLEELIPVHGQIVVARCYNDDRQHLINDGVALFQSTPEVKTIVERISNTPLTDKFQCGQDVLEYMVDHVPSVSWCVKMERQKAMNSFLYTEYGIGESTIGHWTPGDFVLHLPGRTNERRVEVFTQKLQHVLR